MATSNTSSSETSGEDPADEKAVRWARRYNYDAKLSASRSLQRPGRRPIVLQDLPAAGPKAAARDASAPRAGAAVGAAPTLQIDVTNTAAIKVLKGLKGGDTKKTCMVNFGGKPLVVKGGSADSANHVASADFLRELKLKGVSVPDTRLLTADEARALGNLFKASSDKHARQLAATFELSDPLDPTRILPGQLSAMADGVPPQKAFPTDQEKRLRSDNLVRIKACVGLPRDQAWTQVCDELLGLKKINPRQRKLFEKLAEATSRDERKDAIDAALDAIAVDEFVLVLDLLRDIDADRVDDAFLKGAERDDKACTEARDGLSSFCQSDEGIGAYAGLAVADMIAGMNDRLIARYNGGNFLFDPAKKQLVCVDNHKAVSMGMSVEDPAPWKKFINDNVLAKGGTLVEGIYWNLYGNPDDTAHSSSPSRVCKFNVAKELKAKAIIATRLEEVVSAVEASRSAPAGAKARVKDLRARMELDANFEELIQWTRPAPPVAKLDKTDKALRATKSFFTSNKKDLRIETKKIKSDLRAGSITAAEAEAALDKLTQQNPKLAGDRRSDKIGYLVGVARFCEALEASALALMKWKTDAHKGQLTQENIDQLNVALDRLHADWQTSLANDTKTQSLFNSAWREFKRKLTPW